ncbi:hypothetical protein CH333_10330 [candidate division WOR-3 bacterium JGI_Cruoil_03_44_89]|uniref:Uncharacterized protein n=1 Tax=candidate division WOR-3 bacterium JGI_Cruoil_03_44_89 TaxID=1973748 RepID=A0A235BMM5_UNCW3|nr:MAG: hypothetical protein CH333_10330 [candidate division WOR-3 bacterium JGI_Cruoil_03_44_89]
MFDNSSSFIPFLEGLKIWRKKENVMRDTEKKEVGMLKKVGGTKMRGMVFPLALLIGALIALPLGAAYTPPDRNQNGIPDDKDMMLGIWDPTGPPTADFDGDGVPDSLEDLNKNGVFEPNLGETDPQNIDSDADGITDGEEHMADVTWSGVMTTLPPAATMDIDNDGVPNALDFDSDNDGLLDGQFAGVGDPYTPTPRSHFLSFNTTGGSYRYEFGDVGTDPYNADDDGDGISDGDEVYTYSTNPLSPDTDGDGISDFLEVTYGTNPILPNGTDSDGDGLTDNIEWNLAGDLTIAPDDPDGDGMYSPLDLDSDNDGLLDGVAYTTGTEDNTPGFGGIPRFLNMDSDGDGLADGTEEFLFLTDPYGYTDGDADGLADELEFKHRLNPNTIDTDDDGIVDSTEAAPGDPSDPLVWDAGWGMYISGTPTDTDGDDMPDARDLDSDNDGLFDGNYNPLWTYIDGNTPNENAFGTNWRLADTDGDGLTDGWEAGNDLDLSTGAFERTDPLNPDTDADGLSDSLEVAVGLNPFNMNTDNDSFDPDGPGPLPSYPIYEGLVEDYPTFDPGTMTWSTPSNGANYVEVVGSDHDGVAMDDPWDPINTDFTGYFVDPDGDGLPTAFELYIGTDPYNRDTDGDGLWDGDEYFPGLIDLDGELNINSPYNGYYRSDPSSTDTDGDGLSDFIEITGDGQVAAHTKGSKAIPEYWASNPWNQDTDGDGIMDGDSLKIIWITTGGALDSTWYYELYDNSDGDNKPNICDTDSDNDGLSDFIESSHGYTGTSPDGGRPFNPGDADTDGDGVADYTEGSVGSVETPLGPNPGWPYVLDGEYALTGSVPDADFDGLPDIFEQGGDFATYATLVGNADTDGDGLSDGAEPKGPDGLRATRPDFIDTDGDGISDAVEVGWAGYDLDPSTKTEPNLVDSDHDGCYDGNNGTDPGEDMDNNGRVDAGETDPNNPDSDGDWALDGDEGCGSAALAISDLDGDGLPDFMEKYFTQTDTLDADTDDDGLADGWNDDPDDDLADATDTNGVFDVGEIAGEFGTGTLTFVGGIWVWTDPTDGSSASMAATYGNVTEPLVISTDWDGLQDGTELSYTSGVTDPRPSPPYASGVGGTDILLFIVDADNTTGTNPLNPDCDGDYLTDGYGEDSDFEGSVATTETDPNAIDTDLDGANDGYDGWETVTIDQPDGDGIVNALDINSDGDNGGNDGPEANGPYWTNPLLVDTDGDGRQEDVTGASNESNADSDGDGITNQRDVDSDNDWLIDGDGTLFSIPYAPGTYPSTGEDNGLGLGAIANNGILENPPSGPVGVEETDPTVPEDSDGDGLPDWVEVSFQSNPLDDDTDDDGMADRYCLGTPAPASYDMYGPWPTPLVIGEENSGGSGTPYGSPGFLNYYTTDPRNIDTDADGIQDGTEVATTAGVGGTSSPPFIPDADPVTFTNPYDADTDNDGLADGVEDANIDGMIAGDAGATPGVWDGGEVWTETDPNDICTDEDGLVDSWEVNWAQTDPWTLDDDGDLLGDGQEWHVGTRPTAPPVAGPLPPQLWGVWNANAGNGANNGYTFMADGDVASMTDPNFGDTDGEGFGDGAEDADQNGKWDWTPRTVAGFVGNPYVWPGCTNASETNPCDRDSDHGGVADNTDGLPMRPRRPDGARNPPNQASVPFGDDSYEIIPLTVFPAGVDTTLRVGRDTMFIDPVPGDSGTGMFNIANNGPVNLDDIYATVTDLDWVTDVPTYTAPLWADTLIIPFDSIYIWGVDETIKIGPFPVPAPIITSTVAGADGLPTGDTDDEVWVRVHIPWGQIPGVYEGRLVLWQGDPFFNNPIDTIVFQVEVDPVWEADILNNDSLSNGVGFSDPDSSGAFDNEMHLAAPLTASPTDTLLGVFYKSNPNTEPDVDANYVNDVNGLDALPRYARPPWGPGGTPSAFYQDEWDTLDLYTNPDLQGNTRLDSVYMTYRFISYSGPGFVTADSVEPRIFLNHEGNQDTLILIDSIELGEWDSVLVKIYSYCLPPGTYYGWVYMWKDFDGDAEYNGPPGPLTTEGGIYPFVANNVTPQEADAFDAFILKFTVTAPDIDIVQDEMNIDADNFMTLNAMPGDSVWGIFTVTNPNIVQNFVADPWDGPTTEDADSVGVYDPDLAVLHPLPDSIWLYRMDNPQDSIKAYVYGPTTLDMGEWDATFSVRVNVPVGIPYGTYTTAYDSLNPVTADPNDDFFGKILISATGLWSDAHYISIEPKSYQLLDWFDVRVNVGSTEDIVVVPDVEVDSVDHGAFVIDSFSVINTGNADLYGIIFEPTSLQDGAGHIIHPDNIIFEPPQITELLIGDTAVVTKKIIAPPGQYTGWYTGEITVKDDDAFPSAVILCSLYVRPDYDIDIANNGGNVFGNVLGLSGEMGDVVSGEFDVYNPNSDAQNVDPDPFGNADLDNISYTVTDLEHQDNPLYSIPASAIAFSAPAVLPSGEGETASLAVNIPSGQEDGMYVGTVTAFDVVAGVSDEFELRVQVGAEESIDIVESLTSGSGDHNTEVTLTSFTIQNTGNANLYNLLFNTSGLQSGTYFLSPDDIYLLVTNFWAPVNDAVLDELLIGQTATAQPKVIVRAGQHAGTYTGFMRVMDDDGVPSDAIAVSLEVLSSYDIDIANNGGNVIGDYLTLEGGEGDVLSGEFDVYNPNSDAQNVDPDPFGNDDLVDITYTATNLQNQGNPVAFIDVSCVSFSAPLSLLSGESGTGTVTVAVPTGQEEGTYVGTVTATDASGVTDDFTIVVIIGASLDVDIVEDETSGSGGLAGLDDLVALPQFTVVNPTDAYNPDPDGPSNGDLYDLGFTASVLCDGHEHLIYIDKLYVRTTNYPDPTPISEASIDYLPLGEQAWVEPWVLVKAGQHAGTYLGNMGVIGEQGYPSDVLAVRVVIPSYFDIDIANNAGDVHGNEMALGGNATETVTGHFDIYNPASDEENVDADPFGNDDLGNITYSVTDLGHTENAFAWIMASDITIAGPDALLSGESAVAEVTVNIPSDAISGAYIGTLTVTDDDAGVTDEFTLVVQVGAFEDVDIVEDMTQGTGDHGSSVELSSFTVVNPDEAYNPDPDGPGNTPLYNLRFRVTDLGDGAGHTIDAARMKLAATGFFGPTPVDQAGIDVLEVGQSATVIPTVDVEPGQYAGTYTGMLEVYDDDGFPSDVIGVEVTVEPDYDLDISDNEQNLAGNTMTFANVEMGDALEGYFRLVNPANEDQNVDPDPFGNTDLTDLDWTATDLVFQVPPMKGGIKVKEADKIGDVIPSSAVTVSLPSTLEHGGAENVLVTIDVPTDILAGTYKGSIVVEDGVGDVSDFFYVEVFVRSVARIDVVEDTITGVVGDHGSLSATSFNVTNIGNVKLTGINFTSTNLYDGLGHTISNAGITFDPENMPELAPEESTDVEVTVIIPLGTYGGTYEGTITAKDGAGSVSDEVTIRVTVNPSIDIVEDAITSTGEHGTLFATSFNVTNDGDIKLAGIEFTSTDLYDGLGHMISSDGITIAPENIPEFVPGATELVDVTVDVPLGTYAGTYEGTITAKDGNGSVSDEVTIRVTVNPDYDLDIVENLVSLGAGDMGETLDGQFRIMNPNSEATNVDPDPFGNADLDELSYGATDLAFVGEPAKMGRNGITEYRETIGFDKGGKIGDVISAANVSVDLPSFIASGGGEDTPISVVLPLDVAAGTYEGRVTVTGNGGVSDDIMVRVMVNETEDLDIAEASVEIATVEQGTAQATPDFTIVNTDAANNPDVDDGPGNTTLNGIHFEADNLFSSDGTRFISKDNIDFEPDNISSLTSGASATAHAVIHVPVGTYATTYSGLATALNDRGSVSDTVRLVLTVAPSPYFYVADNEGNLVENTMYVVGDAGTTTPASQFVLKNPLGVGNVDITGITYDVKGLSDFTIGFDQPSYDVAYGGYTVGALTVTIPEDEHEGVYTGWVVFEYTGGGIVVSDSFNLNITVRPNEVVALSVDTLRITGREGTIATGMFSVLNKGNATLTDLELVMLTDLEDEAGTRLPRDRVEFIHPLIDTLAVGGTERIDMSVDIPRFTLDNVYTGEFEVRDKKDGDPFYRAVVVLTVTSETEVIVDENPVTGGRVNIRCKADADFEPTLTILNLAGEIVRFGESFQETKAATTVRVYKWLLDNAWGRKVAPGMYIILIKTKIDGEEKILKDKILVIR